MKKIIICILMFFIFISCSTDKSLTGTYYVKHNNSVKEYLIIKPDSTFIQYFVNTERELSENNGRYSLYSNYGIDLYKYKNGYDPVVFEDKSIFPSDYTEDTYLLNSQLNWSIFNKRQIIIEFTLDIYATKISQSYNSDSILVGIKKKLKR